MTAHGRTGVWLAILFLFLALRLPLLAAREPFFDELMTDWCASKSFSQQWSILQQDSGPPLYYAIAHAWDVAFGFDVTTGRVLSLLFGLATLALCFWQREPRAGALLAAFPPHVFFSTEARGYALAALLVGVGAVLLQRKRVWTAAIALVLAAYAHAYGVLLFPMPFLAAVIPSVSRGIWAGGARRGGFALRPPRSLDSARDDIVRGFLASALAGVLYLPAFWLARVQPREALAWMENGRAGMSLLQLGFAANYEPVFLTTPPLWMRVISALVVLALLVVAIRKDRLSTLFVVFPMLVLLGFAVAGKSVYFPTRFESTLALPLALLLTAGLAALPRKVALGALTTLLALGAFVALRSAIDHAHRPLSPFRSTAVFAASAPPQPIVASGYAYLEVLHAARRDVVAFPAAQAEHPGWLATASREQLERELPRLPQTFVWVGAIHSEEARTLSRRYTLRPVFRDRGMVVAVATIRPTAVPKSS